MTAPLHALAAVSHPNPAAFYTHLAAQPFRWDDALGCWLAASAAAVTAVLTDPNCRVRPVGQPVPPGLQGSAAEQIYRHLVRMKDGPLHPPLKRAIQAGFGALQSERVRFESRRWAEVLCTLGRQDLLAGNIHRLAFDLPVYVLSRLLGVPSAHLPEVARLMRAFAPCLSPTCPQDLVERGRVAVGSLLGLFGQLLSEASALDGRTFLGTLQLEARPITHDRTAVVVANTIGLV